MLGCGVVGGVTTVSITSYSKFKLYYLLLTSTTSFIKIGEVGILGWGVVGGDVTVAIASYSGFKLYYLLLTSTTSFIQIGQKMAKLVFWSGWGS